MERRATQPRSAVTRDRRHAGALRRLKPSSLVLLPVVPLLVVMFATQDAYRRSLQTLLPGLGVTVMAGALAYLAAVVLGLVLAGMLALTPKRRTLLAFAVVIALFAAVSSAFFTRPRQSYALIGAPTGTVAILRGTPTAASNRARELPDDPGRRAIRSVTDVDAALQQLDADTVQAAFIPLEHVPPGVTVLREERFLADRDRNPALGAAAFAVLLLLLSVAGGWSGRHPLSVFSELYIDMIRGVPMLVIILYVGFPLQGALREVSGGLLEPSRFTRGVAAISLGYAAYLAEVFRAGLQAIPRGQREAARSLGLSPWQTARLVVFPQALRIVIPPLGNEFIAMLKDTSLLSILSIRDITQRAQEFSSRTLEYFPAFNTVALLYIGLTLAASSLVRFAERRSRVGEP